MRLEEYHIHRQHRNDIILTTSVEWVLRWIEWNMTRWNMHVPMALIEDILECI
jgi:hypothetical protein